ncbi:protein FAR1-RELATED SEQUENCE 5-like [Daucus carota subsp. sativus]|uniref:protein FAR1-RELATED SEQUENCE 5-like n=1 Tax=Daucus carota subsp. sativus TaxID=79200 RepID=UPI003082914A
MDKQRSETKRLNHECRSGKPALVSKLYLEDDASELYTRSLIYKVQEEILAARDDMRIQSIGPETNGILTYEMKDVKMKDVLFQVKVNKSHANCSCKKFLLCGLLCRHAFYALNHFEVVKIPRRLVLNRWMKNAENKAMLKMFGNDLDKLKQVNKSIQGLDSELGDASGGFTKQDFMANLIGKRPTGDISIQPPLQCKNKGFGLKRIVGEREKAINQVKKKARKCKLCSSTFHDQRTYSTKKKVA